MPFVRSLTLCVLRVLRVLRVMYVRDRPRDVGGDGSVAGEGTYVVASDGSTMTATTAGFDSQLRRFELKTVWERV